MTFLDLWKLVMDSGLDPADIILVHDTVGVGSGPLEARFDLDCQTVLILSPPAQPSGLMAGQVWKKARSGYDITLVRPLEPGEQRYSPTREHWRTSTGGWTHYDDLVKNGWVCST